MIWGCAPEPASCDVTTVKWNFSPKGVCVMTRQSIAAVLVLCLVALFGSLFAQSTTQAPSSRSQVAKPITATEDGGMINVRSYGAVGDGVADDTAAIQAAIDAAAKSGVGYGRWQLQGEPRENKAIGYAPVVLFPPGTYRISRALTYGYYNKFRSDSAIIYQSDPNKDIFYSTNVYQNEWNGLTLIGGRTQIYAQNGVTGGIEGCMIKIRDCEFQASSAYAIGFMKSTGAGGEQGIIRDCRFLGCSQELYTRFDFCTLSDCWLEKTNDEAAPDAAWINSVSLIFTNNAIVPGGNFGGAEKTTRYFDNYGSLVVERTRFGSEGRGGMPLVYNYTDALSADVYPYMTGGQVVIRECLCTAAGGNSRPDRGLIVLKSGIPKVVAIENNHYSFDGPYVRTNLLTGGQPFTQYISHPGTPSAQPALSICIRNNSKWAGTITDNDASTAALADWLDSDVSPHGREKAGSITDLSSLRGITCPQTSHSNGISIVDTELTANRLPNGVCYLLCVSGNPNSQGSPAYRQIYVGILTVITDYSYQLPGGPQVCRRIALTPLAAPTTNRAANLSVAAVFWNGELEATEVPFASGTARIRIKVKGNGAAGSMQQVHLLKLSAD